MSFTDDCLDTSLAPDARQVRHAQLVASGDVEAAARYRADTRRRVRELGEPTPAWAAPRPRGKGRKARPVAPARPAAPPPAAPLELPPALLEWRRANGSHAVTVNADGSIVLARGSVYAGTAQRAHFASMSEAAAAVVPKLPWRAVPKPER